MVRNRCCFDMNTLTKRLSAALLTAEDWDIICNRRSNAPTPNLRLKFFEIQLMRSGDRHDADYMHAREQFKSAPIRTR